MSDSTDNTNELDSYGVWVKNTKQDGQDEELNFADSLDLPDFEETDSIDDGDFADIFKDDEPAAADPTEGDTTLTDDELLNITNGDGIEIEETDENAVTDADLSDFDTDIPLDTEIPSDDEISIPEVSIEDPENVSSETFEDFATDEASVSEEVSTDDFEIDSSDDGEQEISLDDFMEDGFSDSSVTSGNNGFAAEAAPSSGDSEEVSLDDFVDVSDFGITEDAPKKEEAISDEKPLEMDISFDSSADSLQTEENIEVEDSDEYEAEEDFSNVESNETTETVEVKDEDIDAEEVDLSDFGIDADAEETPVTQDVEGAKNKEAIVDYDLSVGNESMSAAPVVNVIEETTNKEEIEEVLPVEETTSDGKEEVDSSLLQQIVADLSSLKDEINTLKSNLEEIKAHPAPAAENENAIISEEIAIDDEIEEDSKEDTGFFSGDDGDDTIALSTDELSNILNTADFNTEEVAAEESPAEEEAAEEDIAVEEEFAAEEVAIEEDVPEEEDFAAQEEAPAEEIAEEAAVAEEFDFAEEAAETEETVEVEESTNETVFEEDPGIKESLDNFEEPSDQGEELSYDFTEDNLSEPNLDDIEIDEESLEDDLPDEISIPKDDDILVESSSSDFMDSVQDTTEDQDVEEAPGVDDENFSTVDNLFEEAAPASDISEASAFANVEEEPAAEEEAVVEEEPAFEEEAPAEEAIAEDTFVEEPVVEEEPIVEDTIEEEEPVIVEDALTEDATIVEEAPLEESPVTEAIDNDFVSHEEDNNNLTDSNIDYLTTEEKEEAVETDDNAELKKDIKSVLLYMDQLLENLPEEKIVEFAKSEEFTTYKKLFSELGLS